MATELYQEDFAKLLRGRVAVIGDLMIDQYAHGEVLRISPEAPIPILQVTTERHVLGGAANVAANIAALGGKAHLLGIIGADANGLLLQQLAQQIPRIQLSAEISNTHPTTKKTRYTSGQQQIVRVDRESRLPYPDQTIENLISKLSNAINSCDVIVLSDYGKGVLDDRVLQATLSSARARGKTVIVDPKRSTFTPYRGADYIAPNSKELSDATGLPCAQDDEAALAAAAAFTQCGSAILLTRSERGMSLFRHGTPPIHLAANAREVFDVSGAGDTVVAAFSLGLAAGLSPEQAMALANTAAGIVVGKLGTATCTNDEVRKAFANRGRRDAGMREWTSESALAAISLDQACALRSNWKNAGLTVGLTNGCFDILHPGHISILRAAANACDRLIVAINSDDSVRRLKGIARPLQDQAARADILLQLKGVACVVAFDEDTPIRLIDALQPDLLVKGADYREDQVVGADVVKARGGRIMLVDIVPGHSTTRIVEAINAAD